MEEITIRIRIRPTYNKYVKNSHDYENLLHDTLVNEMGRGDLDGEIIESHLEIKHDKE